MLTDPKNTKKTDGPDSNFNDTVLIKIKKYGAKPVFTAPLLMCVIIILSYGTRYIGDEILGYGESLYLSLIILQIFTIALPCIFYTRLRGQNYSSEIGLKLMPLDRIGFIILISFTMILGSIFVKLTLGYMGIDATEYSGYVSLIIINETTTFTDVFYMLSAFAVLPAIIHEFAFRGIIMTEYGKGFAAMVFSSFFYALSFLDFERFPIYLLCGIFYSLTMYITRSLIASIFLHILYSAVNLFTETYVLRIIYQPEYRVLVAFAVITLFLIFLSATFGEAERIFYNEAISDDNIILPEKNESLLSDGKEASGESENTKTKKSKHTGGLSFFLECVLSPTFIACVIIAAAGGIMQLF